MRIGRVQLQNFKAYEDAEVIFDQALSIIRSENAAGKTSLVQAIQLALTCQSDGTTSDGKGAGDKIRLGADKAVITLGMDTAKGPMELVTTYHPGKRVQVIHPGSGGDEATVKQLADGFKMFLDSSGERLSCVLDSEYFIGEKPAEQKSILASVVLPRIYNWDEKPEDAKMKALATKYLPSTKWNRPPVIVIDEVYGDTKSGVYNLRTQAKSALSGIYIPPKPTKPEFDAEFVQAKLAELRGKQSREAKKVKQGGTVQVGRVEQSLTQEKDKLAQAHADLKAARDKQVLIEADLLDGPTLTGHKQMAAKRKEYDELGTQIADQDADIAAQAQAQQIFSEMLLDANGLPIDEAPCPTCTQLITRKFIVDKVQQHADLESSAKHERQRIADKQAKLGNIAGAEAAIKKQEEKIAEKLAWVATATAATERIVFIEAAIKDLEVALANAKAAEANPIDTSALDALTTEIGEWEARLSPAVQYDSTLKTIADAEQRWQDQNVKVGELETLCAYFGKDGIKARLIKEHIGAFTETVNRVLSVWGYEALLSIEPYDFQVKTPKTAPRYLPLKEMSGFERKAFGVALQSAIAVFSKIKIIMVDAADVMIGMKRNRLLGCIKLMLDNGTLDQAIVLLSDESRTAPQKAGTQFYFIENGKIERL
jgi:hypothetical protein